MRYLIAKPGIAFIDKVLYSVATVNVHKNTNLLRLEFWFCYSIKVSTLYHCVAAVIGSSGVVLRLILKIIPFSSLISRAEVNTAATPSCQSTCFVVQPACMWFFLWAATASPPPAEKRSSRYWQHREGKKCDEKAARLHSVVLSPPVLCFHLLVSTDLCRCLCWIDSFHPCPALIGGCGWSSKWG